LFGLNRKHRLAEMILEDQAGLHAPGAVGKPSVPAHLGDSLELGNHKVIAEIKTQQAVSGDFAIQLDAHTALTVIDGQGLFREGRKRGQIFFLIFLPQLSSHLHISPHYPTLSGLLGFICQAMFLVACVFSFEYIEYIKL